MSEFSLAPEALMARRRAGVLLHPTSLLGPGRHGTLGPGARAWIDFLADAGFGVWQMLPIGPVGPGGSPYQSHCLLAGNPALISLEDPTALGLASGTAPDAPPAAAGQAVRECLRRGPGERVADWESFRDEQAGWLGEFGMFTALRERMRGRPWWRWPAGLRDRRPAALAGAARELGSAVDDHACLQFLFFLQWRALRAHATGRGIALLGDLPIYPAHDSVDVWRAPDCFALRPDGRLALEAGVPPDMFTSAGQRWGTPVYNWERVRERGFDIWRERLQVQSARFDVLRVDHFRGLEAYWAFSPGTPPATGAWRPAPGRELLQALASMDRPPALVAEDLGLITPAVEELRDEFRLPGMRVLQFAFDGDPGNPHLPDHHPENAVAYTGTHDNDTTLGWWRRLDPVVRARVLQRTAGDAGRMPWPLVDATLASRARLAVIPMQDLLGLGSDARLNTPGTARGNWHWRLQAGQFGPQLAERLRRSLEQTDRVRSAEGEQAP